MHLCWARVGAVDMGWVSVDDDIQADSAVCDLNDFYHEEEAVAAFLV